VKIEFGPCTDQSLGIDVYRWAEDGVIPAANRFRLVVDHIEKCEACFFLSMTRDCPFACVAPEVGQRLMPVAEQPPTHEFAAHLAACAGCSYMVEYVKREVSDPEVENEILKNLLREHNAES